MTSKAFDEIESTYLDAIRNKLGDLAKASTPDAIISVTANFVAIEAIYLDAARQLLDDGKIGAKEALDALKDANKEVAKLREDAEKVSNFIDSLAKALGNATKKAGELLEATTQKP